MKIAAFVPVKLKNERTPGKNTKRFDDGTALITCFLRTLVHVPEIDELYVFCSDEARRVLSENKIVGIEYIPVLTGDMITEKENIQQLTFPNVLPMAAIDFIGSHKENICPTCGRKSYEFLEPNMDNWHIVPNAIPKGIDAFITEATFDPGQYREIVISKKLYNVLIEQMKEKHLDCRPVG